MTEHQFGAGGVVMKRDSGRPKVLLIKDSYGHWTWPKGHIEEGETPSETAVREISEETGLFKLEVVEELGKQEYYFTLEGKKIFKTVHIFLVKASSGEKISIQKDEIADALWLDPAKAVAAIEYKGSREMLEKGIEAFLEKCMD